MSDSLEEKLNRVLSDPDSMARLQGLLGNLGKTPSAAEAPPAAPLPDIGKLMPLLSGLQSEGDDARLLRALRPYLHGERADRLDGAIRMVQLSQVLPLLTGGKE